MKQFFVTLFLHTFFTLECTENQMQDNKSPAQRLKDRVDATISSGHSSIYGGESAEPADDASSSLIELLRSSGISEEEIHKDPEALLEFASKLSTTADAADAALDFKSRRRYQSDADPLQCEDDSPPDPDRLYPPLRDADDDVCHRKRLVSIHKNFN